MREYIEQQNRESHSFSRIGRDVNNAECFLAGILEAVLRDITTRRPDNIIPQPTRPFEPSHSQATAMEWYISQDVLRQILDISDLDITDIAYVADKKNQFPSRQRVLTEQIINTQLFRNWLVSPHSTKLLIQWDGRRPKTIAGINPLSVFCASLIRRLRFQQHFVSALWFCGQHMENGQAGARIGGRAMLASLIDQLLRQHTFDMRALHHNINPDGLQRGDMQALIDMLVWLVRQLPQSTTFFCLIDGVVLYEREEFESDALQVFSRLVKLTSDQDVFANVKVLFASTPGPGIVRIAFEAEDLILNVHTLPQMTHPADEERENRSLEESLPRVQSSEI